MSRLIDANTFRRFAHEQLEGNKTYGIDEILEMIDEQPTAYNVDKVVEELEDIDKKVFRMSPKDAIDIVKRGGVE
jgi:RNA-splicing ligase RtcB